MLGPHPLASFGIAFTVPLGIFAIPAVPIVGAFVTAAASTVIVLLLRRSAAAAVTIDESEVVDDAWRTKGWSWDRVVLIARDSYGRQEAHLVVCLRDDPYPKTFVLSC